VYVSDRVFEYMVKHNADFDDPNVQQMRAEDVQTEFVRSLVYSSRVIINRAYLKNNNYLYKNHQSSDPPNLLAFAELARQGAVLPFLFREWALDENLDIDVRREGDRAIRALLRETGDDILCARLTVDGKRNHQQIKRLATKFGHRLSYVGWLDEEQRNIMAPERGARTALYLATSPAVEGVSGKYFIREKERSSVPICYDEALQERMWAVSEQLTGLSDRLVRICKRSLPRSISLHTEGRRPRFRKPSCRAS
jgi:hypothetical protein